jgi:hypothetical protein
MSTSETTQVVLLTMTTETASFLGDSVGEAVLRNY